jgi:hypothetical protein
LFVPLAACLLVACGDQSGDGSTASTPPAPPPAGGGTGSATLSWYPPTSNTDGSPLLNLAAYRVYWGTSARTFPNAVTLNNPGLATYVVDGLAPATWYFTITAVNSAGVESSFSNVVSKTIH